tara:strand:- start:15 stop:215 length:201 start_codon:yes stop_codon:yes gene_type:complete
MDKEPTPDKTAKLDGLCPYNLSGDARNRTRIEFKPINREYIYQLKEDLNLSLSKVINMLITESSNR